jgi:hypothetical protein
MRSIGEVMGLGTTPSAALAKAYIGAGWKLQCSGKILVLCEHSELARIANALKLLSSEFGMKVFNVKGHAEEKSLHCFALDHHLAENNESSEVVFPWAQKNLIKGELAMVVFLSEHSAPQLQKLAEDVGALTTQYGVPFIDSAFSLDAWVMALSVKNQLELPSPLEQARLS